MDESTQAAYPHTIRVDTKGIVWFTLTGSEQVGRLDPEAGEFTIINLPTRTPHGFAGTTQPYGIDISPVDGAVWYGRLFADIIGRIDPQTLEITEYESPVSGPRRMHFDDSGTLWVTGYSEGKLARITYTRDMTFTADGKICTSNNPLPAAALEGGVLQILCIDENSNPPGSSQVAAAQ